MKDKTLIVSDYKNKERNDPLMKLQDGGVVIGEEVDDDNKLYYVIQTATDIVVERASKHRVTEVNRKPISEAVLHKKHSPKVNVSNT